MAKILSKQELVDMCIGATVLGTGGGGPPEFGVGMLEAALNAGKQVKMISLEDVPDDGIVVCPAGIGSIAPVDDEEVVKRRAISRRKMLSGSDKENPYLIGLKALEDHIGRKVDASICVEMGGLNTAVGAMVAAFKGIDFVDADPVGRAIPEVELQTFTIFDVPITPFTVTDAWGDCILALSVANDKAGEQIARSMAMIGNGASMVGRPVEGKLFKQVVIPGTVSKAIRIGKALREAKEKGEDAVEAVVKAAEGQKIFHGVVEQFEWEDKGGFMWGTNVMKGVNEYRNREYKIWYKNENLVSWLDGQPHVVCPDLICVLDSKTGEPVTNSNVKVGMELVVFGIAAYPVWRTEQGVDLLSPKHFGFDIPCFCRTYLSRNRRLELSWC